MIWRRVAAGALTLALVVALVVVLWPEAEDPIEPTRTFAAPSTDPASEVTPSETPTPTATPSLAVPTPDTTGRDFDRIFREIVQFRDWIYAHPNPDLIDLIYMTDCPCSTEAKAELRELIRAGFHFDDEGFLVQSVEVSEDLWQVVRLRVVMQRTPQVLRDADGNVVDSSEGGAPVEFSVALVQPSAREWLVRTITTLAAS